MPYTHKKVGNKYAVYKKGKKVGETEGTKTALNKYLAALHIADKPKKESLNEAQMKPQFANTIEFWVVEKPKSPTENPQMLVHKADPFMFARQVIGGFKPEEVHGFFMSEDEAMDAAHDLVSAVFEAAKALEEKKHTVTDKLSKTITKLQKEINVHMKEAGENPEAADKHHAMAEKKMAMIKELRGKCKMVEAAKQELTKKEEE
jgi:hypothetical protein